MCIYFYHSLQGLSILFRDTQVYLARTVISKQPSHIIRNVCSKLHYILSGWNQHILSYWNWFLCEWWKNVWKIHPRIKYRDLRELRESSQRKRIVLFWMSTIHKELWKQIFIMKRNIQNKLFFQSLYTNVQYFFQVRLNPVKPPVYEITLICFIAFIAWTYSPVHPLLSHSVYLPIC